MRRAVKLFSDRLSNLSERVPKPNVVICAIPQELIDYCGTKGKTELRAKLTPKERKLKTKLKEYKDSGQQLLAPIDEADVGLADSIPEVSDFRRLLKAEAIQIGLPVQLARPSTFSDKEAIGLQDPATRAWNFFAALFYKGGGYPWRMSDAKIGTCYLGISFYKQRRGNLRTSLAQVFTHTGAGLVLRGQRIEWDPRRSKTPHLTEDTAFTLLTDALELYKRQMNQQLPQRLALHKSSQFWKEELEGFRRACGRISQVDFVAFGQRGVRFLRRGSYPPLRGTTIELSSRNYLIYTKGYVPFYATYPGLRIPSPLEVLEHIGDSDMTTICKEILALTKMNWNNTDYSIREPITLQFSREVGKILSHLSEEVIPRPQYYYYM